MKWFKFNRKKSKLNVKAIDKEIGKYKEWEKVSINTSDGDMFFHIQPYISSFEMDQIIENYGKFLEKYAKDIEKISGKDNSRALKIVYGILYSFLVRYKSDILSVEDKVVIDDYSGEQMLLFSMNLITLNVFNSIIEFYDESSMSILFDKFNNILQTANRLKEVKDFVKDLDKKDIKNPILDKKG